MSRATESALGDLHNEVAKALSERIKGDGATAADLNAAIKFLKDNNITATPEASPALQALEDDLRNQSGGVSAADDEELRAALDNVVQFQQAAGHA